MTTPVEALLGRLLTSLGNTTLKLDTLSEARLAPLAGKIVRLDVVPPGPGRGRSQARPLSIKVEGEAGSRALLIEPGASDTPHVIVTGTLPELIAHLIGLRPGAHPDPGRATIAIEGDEALLADLAAVFEQFQPDLGEPMAALIGDAAADNLLGAAEAAFAGLRSAMQMLGNAAQDGARQQFVASTELTNLLDRMSALQLRVDRLGARFGQLDLQRAASRQASRQEGTGG